jgi:hypothetical protein
MNDAKIDGEAGKLKWKEGKGNVNSQAQSYALKVKEDKIRAERILNENALSKLRQQGAVSRKPQPGDWNYTGKLPTDRPGWRNTSNGRGHHMVEVAKADDTSRNLALFNQNDTPRFYVDGGVGGANNAGYAHERIHNVLKEYVHPWAKKTTQLTDQQLLIKYKQAYSDPRLNGIRGTLKTRGANGKVVEDARSVTPAEAFAALLKWFAKQKKK